MKTKLALELTALLGVVFTAGLSAQPTAFTYQGQLTDNGQPATGSYDLVFSLHDAGSGGNQVGTSITNTAVPISNGLFTVILNFGSGVFNGADRWLEIGVRTNGVGPFNSLSPRQALTSAPFAIQAGNAWTSDLVTGNVNASQLVGTISSNNIGAGSINSSMLAAGSVNSMNLAVGAVTTENLADNAVTLEKLRVIVSSSLAITFTNPAPANSDLFGYAVAALDANHVLIGAYNDDLQAVNDGAAYLFDTDGNLLTILTNPTPANSDLFGYAVAAVGPGRVAIGANYDDTGAPNAGAAYLFNTNGALLTTFTNPAPNDLDLFGAVVAAVGPDRVLIGTHWDDIGATNAGAAYLFSTNGTLLTTFTNPSPAIDDEFGYALAGVGQDRVIIGAYRDDTGSTDAGVAYLFATNGTLLTLITNPTPESGEWFGRSVAAVGDDRVLIGADLDQAAGTTAGAAYLFSTNGTLLTTITNPTPEANDRFGYTVAAVSPNLLLIGAFRDNTGAAAAGAAYLFSTNGTLLTTITNPTPEADDRFGHALAVLDKNQVFIGAYTDDTGATGAGTVYLFSLDDPHASGLVSEGVIPGAIGSRQIADGAVGTDQLAIGSQFSGSFTGDGNGLTNLDAGQLSGTMSAINIAAGTITSNLLATGSVTSAQLADGAVTPDKVQVETFSNTFWTVTGNAGTTPGNHFLGTTDNQPLDLRVNNERGWRLVYPTTGSAVILIGGSSSNSVDGTSPGATIGGGYRNNVQSNSAYATIAGGAGNDIGPVSLYAAVGGGIGNDITYSRYATIAGGANNDLGANCDYSAIGGGWNNNIADYSESAAITGGYLHDIGTNSDYSAIGGGCNNDIAAHSEAATIAGGYFNDVGTNSDYSTIGGGYDNYIADSSVSATVAGGERNTIENGSLCATIAGGMSNHLASDSPYGTIAGGVANRITSDSPSTTIAGGQGNEIGFDCDHSTIGGGVGNTVWYAWRSTIAGGEGNYIGTNSSSCFVGGGSDNSIASYSSYATIGGGTENEIGLYSNRSTIGGGHNNTNHSSSATIAGGSYNHVGENSPVSTVSGGGDNTVGSNSPYSVIGGGAGNDILNSSAYATIPGGGWNRATNYAFAAGSKAMAVHTGAFVWSDSGGGTTWSDSDNSVTFRARGGYRFFTGSGTNGAQLLPGATAWSVLSDRGSKKDIEPANCQAILKKLIDLPVSQWHYKWEEASAPMHLGPMAQDFKDAFYPGRDDGSISTLEFDGVALAAIQGLNQKLNQKLEQKETEITELKVRLEKLEQLLHSLILKPTH